MIISNTDYRAFKENKQKLSTLLTFSILLMHLCLPATKLSQPPHPPESHDQAESLAVWPNIFFFFLPYMTLQLIRDDYFD